MTFKHTFVICAYGDSPFLEDCLKSLQAQTHSSEILLYTSTPSPYLEKFCQEHALPYHVGSGKGIGADWNQALSVVETRYVTIAHQDDYYLPDYTQEIMNGFERYPDASIVYSDYAECDQAGNLLPLNTNLRIKTVMLRVMSWFSASRFWQQRILAFGNPISCPAVSYDLDTLLDFQFREDMKTSLDWFAWYQISNDYVGRFVYVPKRLMLHRIHLDSETTATIANQTRSREDLEMYSLFWPKPMAKFLMYWYEKSQKSNSGS